MIEKIEKYKDGNLIHFIGYAGYEYWKTYDARNRLTYFKGNLGREVWYEYTRGGKQTEKTGQEVEKIKELEFLSRKPISRFKLMEL